MYNGEAEFRYDVTFTVGPRFDGAPQAKDLGWIVYTQNYLVFAAKGREKYHFRLQPE